MGNKTRGLILGMLGQLQKNTTFEDCHRNKTFYDGVKHGIKLAKKAIEGMKLEVSPTMAWRNVKRDGLPTDTEQWKEYNVCVLKRHWLLLRLMYTMLLVQKTSLQLRDSMPDRRFGICLGLNS